MNENLEDRIKSLQDSLGITAADIARHLGVSDAIVSRIKRDNRTDSKHLPAIAKFLGTTVECLSEGIAVYKTPSKARRSDLANTIDELIASGRLSPKKQILLLSFANELANQP